MAPRARQGPIEGRERAAGLVVLVITGLAFLLRVYHLASQSLWYDEGFSIYLAAMNLGDITSRTAGDIHPPLYYYLLHGWITAAGRSEFAIRYLSAFCSALTVPATFRLTVSLANFGTFARSSGLARPAAIGILAAFLAAISPFYVWYAQEARMYAMLTLLGVLSSLTLLRILESADPPKRRDLLAWTALSIAAVYTHFYALFILAFQALLVILPRPTARSFTRPHRALAAAFAAVILAYLPWLGITFTRLGADVSYWEGTLDAAEVITKTFLAFAAGHTAEAPEEAAIGLGYLALLCWGCIAAVLDSRRRRLSAKHWSAAAFLLAYLVVPPLLLYAVSFGRPKFHPRYLMLSSPPFYILVAWGLASLAGVRREVAGWVRVGSRAAALAAMAFVVTASVIPLSHYFRNEVLSRDDFRSVAGWIRDRMGPDEAVILCSGHMFPVFEYYFRPPVEVRLPDQPTLSTRAFVDYGAAGDLNENLAGRPGAWLVLWQDNVVDPNGILTSMLDQQGESLPVNQSFWGIRLKHYSLPPDATFMAEPDIQSRLGLTFGQSLNLLGYRAGAPTAYPGEPFPITLYWRSLIPLTTDLQIVVRLLDASGNVWGSYEGRPAAYQYPTFRWQAGDIVPGGVAVEVLPGTPPGDYLLDVGMYPPGPGGKVEARGADGSPLGQSPRVANVTVGPARQAPDPAALNKLIHTRIDRQAAPGLRLMGHDLTAGSARPGDVLRFSMLWQADAAPGQDYGLSLNLADDSGRPVASRKLAIAPPAYPTSRWRAGEVIASRLAYLLPPDAPVGTWRLLAAVTPENPVGSSGSAGVELIELGRVVIVARPPLPAVREIEHRSGAAFEEGVGLLGYAISRSAEGLAVTLYWTTSSALETQYTVFVHVLDSAGGIVGQSDGIPMAGEWPTTAWPLGATIPDTHIVRLPAATGTGEARLAVGLYDPITGRRLSLAGAAGDRLILGPVTLP